MFKPYIELETRHCEGCGQALVRSRWPSGGYERPKKYLRRRFCGWACRNAARKTNPTHPHGCMIARRVTPRTICNRCGTKERLEVHHLDGNPQNNEPDNHEVLCVMCHKKEHCKNRKCSLANCDAPHVGRGYCNKHHKRWLAHGTPFMRHGKLTVI